MSVKLKTGKNSGRKSAASVDATKEVAKPREEELSHSSSEDEDEDEEGGLEKVMELLGEDGLDEVAQLQLGMMRNTDNTGNRGEGSDSDDDEEGEETGDSSDSEREEEGDASAAGDIQKVQSSQLIDEEEDDAVELDALSDDNISIDADTVPRQKVTIDDQLALARVRHNFQLDPSLPWTETLVCDYPHTTQVEDVDDDLNRELAFYKQALHCAQTSKKLAAESNPPLPYTRPSDYFAEMIKSDSHMARIRQKLLDEQAGIKKGEEKRKEREHKKVGKQVQIEKLKERRERGKAEVEKVKGVKRNRQNMEDPSDAFDVSLDNGSSPPPSKRAKTGPSRKTRDQKFGFGGKVGRRAKQNTKQSTEAIFGDGGRGKKGDFSAGKKRGPGGKPKRLGKSRRMNAKR